MLNITLVGCGNMGRTYAEAFLGSRMLERKNLWVLERSPEKCSALNKAGFSNTAYQPGPFITQADAVLLAIKPQDAANVLPQIKPFVREDTLVISIMAGVTLARVQQLAGTTKVIRAMPNLPAQVRQGITVYTAGPSLSRTELLLVQNLLGSTGKCLYVEGESLLDAATAISGSGPGYVFHLMDLITKEAQQLGFSAAQAALLVEQTFLGAAQLVHTDGTPPAEWVGRVASRGGTTQAALDAFAQAGLARAIHEGIAAAYRRAGELNA